LACQIPSCGGVIGKYPGRPFEDSLNAKTELFAFAGPPNLTALGLKALIQNGAYPDNSTDPITNSQACKPITNCPNAFLGPAVVVRFDQNHKNPYGVQASVAVEFEPLANTSVSISGLHIRGVHLGSFYNVNQPNPTLKILSLIPKDVQVPRISIAPLILFAHSPLESGPFQSRSILKLRRVGIPSTTAC